MDQLSSMESFTSPRLPQELCDHAIDLCSDETSSLRALALVCKNWTPRAQAHLFKYIKLDLKFASMFPGVPQQRGFLGKMITLGRHLTLKVSDRAPRQSLTWLFDMNGIISVLEHMNLLSLTIDRDFFRALSPLPPNLSSIQSFDLVLIPDVPFDDLVRCICSLPQLEHLGLHTVNWPRGAAVYNGIVQRTRARNSEMSNLVLPSPSQYPLPTRLRSLAFTDVPIGDLCAWLMQSENPPKITYLEFGCPQKGTVQGAVTNVVDTFLVKFSPSILHLTRQPLHPPTEHYPTKLCISLKRLSFICPSYEDNASWIFEPISMCVSKNIETVELIHTKLTLDQWRQVAILLGGEPFRESLKLIVIRLPEPEWFPKSSLHLKFKLFAPRPVLVVEITPNTRLT